MKFSTSFILSMTTVVGIAAFPARIPGPPKDEQIPEGVEIGRGARELTTGIVTKDLNFIDPEDLVDTLIGGDSNLVISNVVYKGAKIASGTFKGGEGIIGFDEGIVLTSGATANVVGPNTDPGTTTDNTETTPGDKDLNDQLPNGMFTMDASVLEFDFECNGLDNLHMKYVFASEEYVEFVNSDFNDVFGFFLNGQDIALVPGLPGVPVAINSLNCADPDSFVCTLFIDNTNGQIDTEMDGLTVELPIIAKTKPGINHIKIAVADVGDGMYDSAVFIKSGSFMCVPITESPSVAPSDIPSMVPSKAPSKMPSGSPSVGPTVSPSMKPSGGPSGGPSVVPSEGPSASPSASPSVLGSVMPSGSPTAAPTGLPSVGPSGAPSAGPTGSPTAGPSVAPSPGPTVDPTKQGVNGDPHITAWTGMKFDYQGACDLVLVQNPSFANGLGMDIHIRAKLQGTEGSYIETVVVKIGNDVLEVKADYTKRERQLWLNGVANFKGSMDGVNVSGYPVLHKKESHKLLVRKRHVYIVQLSETDQIVIKQFKHLLNIHFHGSDSSKQEHFKGTLGLMGSFDTGLLVGRDGTTEFADLDKFGEEWQVLSTEPNLFQEADGPQHPDSCIYVSRMEQQEKRRELHFRGNRAKRRLTHRVSEDEAAKVCSILADETDRKNCIFDVVSMNDLDMVGIYMEDDDDASGAH